MKTLLAAASLIAAVSFSSLALAQSAPGDIPSGRRPVIDDGSKPWMFAKSTDPPSRDFAKEDLIRSQNNKLAYDPKRPATLVYAVAAPVVAFYAGMVLVDAMFVTGAPAATIAAAP